MNKLNWLDALPLKEAVGWTILHSLWQLTLLALILQLLLRSIPRKRPELRYAVLLSGLLAGMVWTGITFSQQWQQHRYRQIPDTVIPMEVRSDTGAAVTDRLIKPPSVEQESSLIVQLDSYMPAITIIWLIGMFLFSLYLLSGLAYLKYLQMYRVTPPDTPWPDRLTQLRQMMGVKQSVGLFLSEAIHEPITFQLFKPVILVPVFFFTGLTPAQAEVLLLHEVAHIRRHDFTVNLLQSIVEILLFFHPAIWWLSGKIREEREYCCDNAVLAVQENPLLYVEALTRIQSDYFSHKNRLAMSANGKTSMLSKRVFRLFGRYDREPVRFKSVLIALLLLMLSFSTQAFLVREDSNVNLGALPVLKITEAPAPVQLPEAIVTAIAEDEIQHPEPSTAPVVVAPKTTTEELRDTLPLYVIDGVRKSPTYTFSDLKPDQIKAISVLKGPKATEKYGKAAEYGVIEITTKQPSAEQPAKSEITPASPAENGTIRIRAKTVLTETLVIGKVLDDKGEPLIGANILIKGTKIGTVTDFHGDFQLKLPEDCVTLVISYIGRKTVELKDVCAGEEKVIARLAESESTPLRKPKVDITARPELDGPIVMGKVVDEGLNPMIGTNIIVKGTSVGTVTDFQGDFRLQLPENCGDLVFSYVGMKPHIVKDICNDLNVGVILIPEATNTASPTVTADRDLPNTNSQGPEQEQLSDLNIFPNPSGGTVNTSFQLKQRTRVKVQVYTLDGKLVITLNDGELEAGLQQLTWNAAADQRGAFLIQLEIEEKIINRQVIIE